MVQKNLDMIWVNFISGPDEEPVLECEVVMLHGQKSKIGEVLCEVQMVECLAYDEGGKTFVRKTDSESRRRERSEKRSRDVLGSFCFSPSLWDWRSLSAPMKSE